MPCYDGCREDERQDRETARKVEATLCAVITAFGGRRVFHEIDFAECGVTMEWLDRWWVEHQRKDAARKKMDAASKEALRKQAILDSGDYKVLHQMITKPVDIHATVANMLGKVPPGCETIAPPCPTVEGVRTTYYGDVRLVEAFDPIEGIMVRRADLYYREK